MTQQVSISDILKLYNVWVELITSGKTLNMIHLPFYRKPPSFDVKQQV